MKKNMKKSTEKSSSGEIIKIDFISDTHMAEPELKGGDILIHGGDMTYRGTAAEVRDQLHWLNEQDYSHIILIAGNHDFLFEENPILAKSILREYKNITYLENSMVEIEGLKIWGSPYTPWFHNWAFNLFEGELKKQWDKIPDVVDILITHGPPYMILDKVKATYSSNCGEHVGCIHLLNRIKEVKPLIHMFGHIHEGYGINIVETDDTIFMNASIMDERYKPVNKPFTFHLDLMTRKFV